MVQKGKQGKRWNAIRTKEVYTGGHLLFSPTFSLLPYMGLSLHAIVKELFPFIIIILGIWNVLYNGEAYKMQIMKIRFRLYRWCLGVKIHRYLANRYFRGVVCLHFADARCLPPSSSLCMGKRHLSSVAVQELRVPFDSDRDCREAWERERETVHDKIIVLQCVLLANK